MIDLDDPNVRRHVAQKQRLREAHERAGARATSTSADGAPPGQRWTRAWVKLDLGREIPQSHDPWRAGDAFTVVFDRPSTGSSARVTLGALRSANGGDWTEFGSSEWHCVTGWSARGLAFRGVSLDVVLDAAFGKGFKRDFACLFQTSADGYTVSVDARDLSGAFLAVEDGDGKMLSRDHGGPRLCFPTLYGWKSAKYLNRVTLFEEHEDGFWEKLGCSRRGRWAHEERWQSGSSARVWTVLAWITNRYRFFGEGVWVWVMVRGGAALGALCAKWTSLFDLRRSETSYKRIP